MATNNKTIFFLFDYDSPTDQDCAFLQFAFNQETVDVIKTALDALRDIYVSRSNKPSNFAGGWRKQAKAWFIGCEIWREFRALLEQGGFHFILLEPSKEKDDNTRQEHQPTKPVKRPNLFIDWLRLDPSNELLLHSTYKDLCLLLHPDKLNDNKRLQPLSEELMKLVNNDFDQFRKQKAS